MSVIYSNLKDIKRSLYNIVKHIFKGWTIWKTFNLSNLFKLIFIYIFVLVLVITVYFDYSEGFWRKAIRGEFSQRRFSVYSVQDRIGEGLLYDRVIEYAKMNGYDYSGCKFSEHLQRFPLTEHFYNMAASILNYVLKPDFALSVTHHVTIVPSYGYNVAYLNMPREGLYTAYEEFQKRWDHLQDYDAYVDLYTLSNGDNKLLKDIIAFSGKQKPIIPVYISQFSNEYKELEFNKILMTGSLWGCNRGSLRVKFAIKRLAEDGLLEAIGLKDFDYLGKYHKGRMEDYGDALDAIIERHQHYGISLIIHSKEHMMDGIPTSRISESAASSAIIIADRNKFLEHHFADAVLFIDVNQEDDGIYQQIKNHVQWIKDNPEEAKIMARRSSDIFNNNFAIEVQMENLFGSIEKIKADKG